MMSVQRSRMASCAATLLSITFCCHLIASPSKPKILYYNSETEQNFFWRTTSEVMQAACKELGMELEIIYLNRDPFFMLKNFTEKAQSPGKPDAVVFQNLRTTAVKMLEIAEKQHIPALIFNAGLTDAQVARYGKPREHFKYWIGQILPDDEEAGYDLGLRLFEEAKKAGFIDNDGKIHVVSIDGTATDTAAIERKKGLHRAFAKENHQLTLDAEKSANWQREEAAVAFQWLTVRNPKAKVFWAANDLMALGILDAMKTKNLVPGKDLIVGSIDWVPEAIEKVQSGELVTSYGGHFMETAWVAILLYDYFNKKDFATEAVSFRTSMAPLSRENINTYLQHFKAANLSKVSFSSFSKVKQPLLSKYDFSFAKVLTSMSQKKIP